MEAVYSTATVQMEDLEGGSSKLANLSLEPGTAFVTRFLSSHHTHFSPSFYFIGLTKVFSESTNETRLREAWLKWRDATGPKMRTDFITYYQIGNKAAKANKLKGKSKFFSFVFRALFYSSFLVSLPNAGRPVDVQLGNGRHEGAS